MAQDGSTPQATGPVPPGVPDGRYLGTTGRWWVELRVDTAGGGLLSADLHTTGADGRVRRLSGRSSGPAPAATRSPRRPVRWSTGDGTPRDGWIALTPSPDVPAAALARFHVEGGEGEAVTVAARVARTGGLLRDLGLEVEIEAGVEAPRRVVVDGEHLDVEECLRRSGFDVAPIGSPGRVEAPARGRWHTVDALEQLGRLHTTMAGSAQAPLDVAAWEAHLLLLSRSDREGLLGVMFDLEGPLPRQGAAVFLDEVRAGREGADADRRVLQMLLHELGHVLNLPHRFAVGRWDSTSFMNYDWCYLGGRNAAQFQEHFGWSFDDDELAFLRHGPREAVVPGGGPFGAGTDWADAAAAGTAPGPDGGAPGLSLWLTPPGGEGPLTITEGDPVFLEVSLANTGEDDVAVPRHALDAKAGLLDVLVLPPDAAPQAFVPVLRRCYAVGDDRIVRLRSGESLHENVNLTLGSAGAPFDEPGRWRVRPVLLLPSGGGEPDGTAVVGEELEVLVEARAADGDGALARRPDVRTALALGGTAGRGEVRRTLQAYADGAAPDPLRAAAQRVRGLELARDAGDPAGTAADRIAAADLLEEALDRGEDVFDPHTREHTRRLAARCRAGADGAAEPPRAVVEFATGSGDVVSIAAGLRGNASGAAWRVLVPLTDLPAPLSDAVAGAQELHVAVVLAHRDGLTERVVPERVELLARAAGEAPCLAVLELARPVPAAPATPFDASRAAGAGQDVATVLAEQGVVPAGSADGPRAAEWAAAASTALAGRAVPAPAVPVVRPQVLRDLGDVGAWVCWLIRICGEDEPDRFRGDRDRYPWPPPRRGQPPAQSAG
ncbi:hypothetical protein NUM3379_22500 [Kineococcus sp. NUM-3379]